VVIIFDVDGEGIEHRDPRGESHASLVWSLIALYQAYTNGAAPMTRLAGIPEKKKNRTLERFTIET
jgi:hypothetical protein